MKVLNYNNTRTDILEIRENRRDGIFNWGADNLEPQLVENLVRMSVTAKNCVSKVAKALYGKSFGSNYNTLIVNELGHSINDILRIISLQYATHKNTFIHVDYNLEAEITSIKVLESKTVRVGKRDDGGYTGTYKISNDWSDRTSNISTYYAYNPIKSVIANQIKKSGGIKKYPGQILHIQSNPNNVYTESDIEPVKRDAVLQKKSQEFRYEGSENGFMNTKVLVTNPFPDEETKRKFLKEINNNRGTENTSGVIVLETAQISDDLTKEIYLTDLTSNFNDKLFEYSDKQAKRSIAEAFNVPSILIGDTTESVFSNSGELIREASKILWEDREEDRNLIEATINTLMANFHESGYRQEYKIISKYEENELD